MTTNHPDPTPPPAEPAPSLRPVILCEPRTDCADPHIYRWHCMRGHKDGDRKAIPGVCPLLVCDRRGANRQATEASR